jgi:hypothetical protein
MRPFWRYRLFLIALRLFWWLPPGRLEDLAGDLMAWCVLPEWMGREAWDDVDASDVIDPPF